MEAITMGYIGYIGKQSGSVRKLGVLSWEAPPKKGYCMLGSIRRAAIYGNCHLGFRVDGWG